jgi:hypothetical protein
MGEFVMTANTTDRFRILASYAKPTRDRRTNTRRQKPICGTHGVDRSRRDSDSELQEDELRKKIDGRAG